MCLIVLYSRQIPGCSLLVGANREERYDRASTGPRWLPLERGGAFAGQDARAGGTWLGVNGDGVLAAITNRRLRAGVEGMAANPDLRSRGLLCLDALQHSTASAALEWCRRHLEREPYAPFNLLLADGESAWVIHGRGLPEAVELPPGVHVLADGDVDDRTSGRVARATQLASPLQEADVGEVSREMRTILADGDPAVEPRDRLCRRLDGGGTVSSAIIAIPDAGLASATFLYAPGPPDEFAFEDLSGALRASPPQSP